MEFKPAKIKFDNLWAVEERTTTSKYKNQYEICKSTLAKWFLPLSSEIVYETINNIVIEPRNKK